MHRTAKERRLYPRIKASLRVQTAGGLRVDTTDVSESGVGLSSVETIATPSLSLQIRWPKTKEVLSVDARLVWKRDIEDTGSVYGMEFVGLDDEQKRSLRQALIKIQVAGLLEEITDNGIKDQVAGFFLQDILDYVGQVTRLNVLMHKSPGYSQDLQEELERTQTQILLKGYCLEELLENEDVIRKVKHHFRSLVGAWVYKSQIIRYGFEKPRGVGHDYKMLEMIYDNKPVSKDAVGVYFDNDFLHNSYSVALRSRKDRMKEYLQQAIAASGNGPCLVFSLGSGSCRELRELVPSLDARVQVVFTCLDADKEALQFSHASLLSAASDAHKACEFRFIGEEPSDICKTDSLAQSFGKQHLVYSMGAFDCLPDAAVKKIIPYLYGLLAPGGKLIITHKNHEKTFPAISPDWFCDWKFQGRSKDDVLALLYHCGIFRFALTLETDDFNYILYFIITKLP
jgi:hypothetical protein